MHRLRHPGGMSSHWRDSVKSLVVQVVSLAHYAIVQARGKAAHGRHASTRQRAKLERLQCEIALLREELRIKDSRMARMPPQRRPHYGPTERLAILELRAGRGWSLAQAAARFLVSTTTLSTWRRRLDEHGSHALVRLAQPVNKFPDLVHYLVRRLKVLCPAMGKVQVAHTLARAGLHLGATTVRRILRDRPRPRSDAVAPLPDRHVTAKWPNHVWHIDLTAVPTAAGFWAAWLPSSFPLCWPFCWWVAVIVDQYSRRVMGVATFPGQPKSQEVRAFLAASACAAHGNPKHLVCDKGPQFWCQDFQRWCRRRNIGLRYGAVGRHGSIAVVERFIRTLKDSCTRRLFVPFRKADCQRELQLFADWYNRFRPHSALAGRTPDEVYHRCFSAVRRPRYEPRSRWPKASSCARPWALPRGRPGAVIELEVTYHAGRRHLPIISLHRAA